MDEVLRCPFLNSNNLCDIILNMGEEHISYICTHHPRFYNYYKNHTEMGYGLCCEEAVRLLLSGELKKPHINGENPLFYLRDKIFDIVIFKDYTIEEKFYYILDMVKQPEEYYLRTHLYN